MHLIQTLNANVQKTLNFQKVFQSKNLYIYFPYLSPPIPYRGYTIYYIYTILYYTVHCEKRTNLPII
jgi:hypothetical protein